MASVRPKALRRGDIIAFVAPSARINHVFPLRIERARTFLEAQGFVVREIYAESLPTASFRAAVEARAAELHAAFRDPAVAAIVCCIGGLSANELLPRLDYDLIRANPKIFVGSSDITLLHYALLAAAGLRTFYGPSAITQLGEFPAPLAFSWDNFVATLMLLNTATTATTTDGNTPLPRAVEFTDEFLDFSQEPGNLRPRKMRPAPGWKWLRGGKAQGRIVGGCLPSVLQLFGTPWEVSYKGKILLLELPEGIENETPWPLELVRWNLGDLGTRGVWSDICGLVLGRPYMHTDEQSKRWEDMVMELTEEYDFPILSGVDVGHTDPMLTIPLDALCSLNSEQDEWHLLEHTVEE